MSYCGPRGIPHSVFLEWSPDDRDKALWWHIYDRQRCPSCGTRHDEWNPKEGGDRHAYRAEEWHCRGCEVMAGAQEGLSKAKDARRGTTVRLVKNRG